MFWAEFALEKQLLPMAGGDLRRGVMVRWEMKKWVYGEENAWVMGGDTIESKRSQRGRREEGERIRRSIEETRDGLMVRDCRE